MRVPWPAPCASPRGRQTVRKSATLPATSASVLADVIGVPAGGRFRR
jgi:hypothetical protein